MTHDDNEEFKVICSIPGPASEDYTQVTKPFLSRIGKLLRRQLRHEKAAGCLSAPEPATTFVHSATVEAQLWQRAFHEEPPARFGSRSFQEH